MRLASLRSVGNMASGKKILRALSGAAMGAMLATTMVGAAAAQQVENLGTSNFWTAWKGADSTGTLCFISSQPQDAQPTGVNRSPIHFIVINRLGMGTKNEIQIFMGYPLNADSKPEIVIDDRAFSLIVVSDAEETAWGVPSDEGAIIAAMKAGSKMVVKGLSKRGTNTTDTYSLSGVTASMNAIETKCG